MVGEAATVLSRKIKVRFFGFTGGKEALVEDFEDGVVARSYQGGHVEHGADIGAPASDMALAAELAAAA